MVRSPTRLKHCFLCSMWLKLSTFCLPRVGIFVSDTIWAGDNLYIMRDMNTVIIDLKLVTRHSDARPTAQLP